MVRWRVISGHPLVWRSWDDDEHVVYHTGTGDTHLLNDVAAEILVCLEVEALTCEELARRCGAAFGVEPDEGLRGHVAATLDEFDDLGLIEAAP